jgi:F0F1-type ATP synthase epsilon subunit
MANTIHVDIVSAEGEIYAGEAKFVFAPAAAYRSRAVSQKRPK